MIADNFSGNGSNCPPSLKARIHLTLSCAGNYSLYVNLTHQFPHRKAISSLLDFLAVLLDHLCHLQSRGDGADSLVPSHVNTACH